MADDKDKTLGFAIQISGVSNEADQLAKITLEVAKLTKAKQDLLKAYKDGYISETQAIQSLSSLTRELNTQKDAQSELKKVVDSAPDSLNRMRAVLINLKEQYANGSTALREQMVPQITALTTKISTAEQAIGVHTRGVGNYSNSIKSAIGTIVGIAAPAAAAAFALNGLKNAFAGTEAGANLLGRAKVQMMAFFDAIVEGRWRYAFGNELPKDIKVVADLMNKVRIDERAELVAVSDKELQIHDLRLAAIKAGKDTVEQIKLLSQAEQLENDKITIRLNLKGEELDYINKILKKDPENTAALNKQAQLEADINNILGDRSIRLASQLEKQQEKLNTELDKTLSKTEEIALKTKTAIDKGLDNTKSNPLMINPLNWKVSDEVASVNYKDHVKKNLEDIANLADEADAREVAMTTKMEEAKLRVIEAAAETKLRIISGATNLLSSLTTKNKTVQKAELVAEKALAIAEIIIQTQVANAQIRAKAAASTLPGPGYFLRVLANEVLATPLTVANNVAAGLNIAAVVAATVTGLAGFSRGGKINRGIPINTGTVDDRLIAVNRTETVLTQAHVARLGGSGVMHQIGVPGYAMGGYVGSQTPHIAPAGFNASELERVFSNRIDRLEVRLDTNKVRSSLHEVELINTTNKL